MSTFTVWERVFLAPRGTAAAAMTAAAGLKRARTALKGAGVPAASIAQSVGLAESRAETAGLPLCARAVIKPGFYFGPHQELVDGGDEFHSLLTGGGGKNTPAKQLAQLVFANGEHSKLVQGSLLLVFFFFYRRFSFSPRPPYPPPPWRVRFCDRLF